MSIVDHFDKWLEFLDSHDGRLYRRANDGKENDYDLIATIPPGRRILTVGDLRRIVELIEKGRKYEKMEEMNREESKRKEWGK